MHTRDLQRPLGRSEVADLSKFLATTPGAMPFPEARGFLTAIASAPTTIMTSVWQSELLGESAFASIQQAQHVMGLVMRLYNQILTELNEDGPLAPPVHDDEATGRWCTGYLKAARMDDVWIGDQRGVVFLFPFAVLAGEADLVGEEDSDGTIIEDPTPQLRRCRDMLETTVREANQYWVAWRRKSMTAPVVSRPPKVGRNEPCPCGSGLKFKKCCALKES
ncbi:MAG: UPF0149 family protein [Deltaproteobacteria bacterium]